MLYSLGHGYVYHEKMLGPGWHGTAERQVWSETRSTLTLSRNWSPSGEWPAGAFTGNAGGRRVPGCWTATRQSRICCPRWY